MYSTYPIRPDDGAPDRSGAGGRRGSPGDDSGAIALGERLSRWLLELHRDCRDPKPAEFCSWALDRLVGAVPFDSASWGHGEAAPIVIHEVYLHHQPPDKAEAYARFKRDDYLFPEVLRRPGTMIDMYDLVPRTEYVRRPIYRHYARRFGGEHALCTALPHTASGLGHFVNLWRAELERPFSPMDRAFKQLVMPHLADARRLNLLEHARLQAGAAQVGSHAAVCDPLGTLHVAEQGFTDLLAARWPGWSGPRLPDAMCGRMRRRDTATLNVGDIVLDWQPIGSMRPVRAWKLGGADRLSPRERDVARLLAEGHSHKATARILGVAPTTIRTQTYRMYRKLGVRNRAQMVGTWLATGIGPQGDRDPLTPTPTRSRP